MKITKSLKAQIIKILVGKNKEVLGGKNANLEKKSLEEMLDRALCKDRLVLGLDSDNRISYFFIHRLYLAEELNQEFIYVYSVYCREDAQSRKKFKARIKEVSTLQKREHKVKKILIDLHFSDKYLINYFSKMGKETYRLLVGDTKKGLSYLMKKDDAFFNIVEGHKKDISKLVALEKEAHLADKTSRLFTSWKKYDLTKNSRGLYKRVIENKSCIIVKDKQGMIAGCACYFIDKEHKKGLIASIFVTHSFQGQGVGKILYKQMLLRFLAENCNYYLGGTTTNKVISLSEKMQRRELLRGLII